MKNLFKTATLVAALTLSTGFANANEKIGFVDASYVLQNHPLIVQANEKVEGIIKSIEQKFAEENKKLETEDKALSAERQKIEEDASKLNKEHATLEASLKKKMDALEKEAPRLRSKDIQSRQDAINAEYKAFQNKAMAFQKRENEFAKKLEQFQKKVADFQAKVEKEKQANQFDMEPVQKQVIEEIDQSIKKLAAAKGYTLILSPSLALYAKDENANITQEVLEDIKQNGSKSLPVETQAK